MSNISLSPTGKRVLAEARGEIFTIPEEKGDVRNITNSSGSAERQPAWSPDGKWISYFSDKSGEYKLVIESQDGIGAPREIAFQKAAFYYTPVWSPDSKKLLYTDTNLNVWVMDIATGQAKTIGNDPWMVPQRTLAPSWSPDSKWVAFASRLNTLYRAIVVANVETGEKHQITDGLADAMYPVWDASGKYLWFLASTDFGLASQWLDMTSYGREETFALYLAVLNKTDAEPAAARERRRSRRGRAVAGRCRPRNRIARAEAAAGGDDRFRSAAAAHPAGDRRAVAAILAAEGRQRGHGVLPRGAERRRRARQHPASLPPERAAARTVPDHGGRVRGQRRRQEARLPHGAAAGESEQPGGHAGAAAAVPRRCRQGRAGRQRRPARRRRCACISIRRPSSRRSSTKAGACSATISTCRTCRAPTGRA